MYINAPVTINMGLVESISSIGSNINGKINEYLKSSKKDDVTSKREIQEKETQKYDVVIDMSNEYDKVATLV
jgi:hypothetical protein